MCIVVDDGQTPDKPQSANSAGPVCQVCSIFGTGTVHGAVD